MNSTTDYSMFKRFESNRPIIKKHVEDLKEKIMQNNLLPAKPILVSNNYEVLDGQHRLQAAKELGLPIYYTVIEDGINPYQAIKTLNTAQKNWKISDYANFYAAQGNLEYKKVIQFAKKYGLEMSKTLNIMGSRKSEYYSKFRKGEFVCPDLENYADTLEKYLQYCDLVIQKGGVVYKYIVGSDRFFEAFISFTKTPDLNWDRFLQNTELYIDKIYKCVDRRGYLQMLFELYNHNQKKKINSIDFI